MCVGVNNEYHVKTRSPLVQKYKDSINERMHIDRAYEILTSTRENDMLRRLKPADSRLMRDYVDAIIIATDMARHKKLVSTSYVWRLQDELLRCVCLCKVTSGISFQQERDASKART